MTDYMKEYRGTVVGVINKTNMAEELPKALNKILAELDASKELQIKFPHGCPVSAVKDGDIVEGNVIRYDGLNDLLCVLDHESHEEVWVKVSDCDRLD